MNSNLHIIDKHKIKSAIDSAILSSITDASKHFVEPLNHRGVKCSVEGCERFALAKGYCNGHYIRHRSGKDMNLPLRAKKMNDECYKCGKKTGVKGGWGLCSQHYRSQRYKTIKDAVIEVMGGKCCKCGGVFPRGVYDFHHHGDKTYNPSELIIRYSAEKIAEELSKCVLICANCHRIEHESEL